MSLNGEVTLLHVDMFKMPLYRRSTIGTQKYNNEAPVASIKSIAKSQKLNTQDNSFSRRHECFTTCGSLGSLPPLQISGRLNKLGGKKKQPKETPGRGGNPQQPSVTSPSTTFSVKCLQKSAQQEPPVSTLVPLSDVVRADTGLCHPTSSTFGAFREACFIFNEAAAAATTSLQKPAKMSGHNAPKRLQSVFFFVFFLIAPLNFKQHYKDIQIIGQ